MVVSHIKNGIEHLRRGALCGAGAGISDGQLLERYLDERDAAALAALIHRHGDMVWGVCRRLLPNLHDAEDAFQATFLVLVRRAACVTPRGLVGNWLYGVAYQTALKARARAAQRRAREKQVTEMPEPEAAAQDLWSDLQPLLDRELSRLPDRHRAVLLLCDLEGKTRKEAARQLGVPEGTVAGWLVRARTRLAKRLTRHGLGLSGGALATLLSQSANAAAPTPVLAAAVKAASLLTLQPGLTGGAVSTSAALLADSMVKLMFLKKLKIGVALVLTAALLAAGAGMSAYHAAAAPPPAKNDTPKQADPAQPAAKAQANAGAKADVQADALAGRWLMTLPAGFRYVSTIRSRGDKRYDLVKGVRFGGGYELRGKRFVLVAPQGQEDAGFEWESRGPDEFTLVAQPAGTGNNYLGATLRRLAEPARAQAGLAAPAWQARLSIRGHQGPTAYVELAPDGKTLITFDPARSELRFWDTATWTQQAVQPLAKVFSGGGSYRIGSFAPDSKTALAVGRSVGADDRPSPFVALFDVPSGKLRALIPGGLPTFSPDGRLLAVGSAGSVTLYDVATAQKRTALKIDGAWSEGQAAYYHLGFSPDGRALATSRAGVVRLWDTGSGKERAAMTGYFPTLSSETSPFAPDGKTLATAEMDRTVRLWDVATGRERRPNRKPPAEHDPPALDRLVNDLDHDDFAVREQATRRLAELGEAAEMALRDALRIGSSLEVRRRIEPLLAKLAGPGLRHELPFVHVIFAPDSKTIATLGDHVGVAAGKSPKNGRSRQSQPVEVKLWDIATGAQQLALPGATLDGNHARFGSDGKTLAYLRTALGRHGNDCLVLWDLAAKKERALIPSSHVGRFSPDGKLLLTQGPRDVTFWDVATGAPLASLSTGGVRRLSFWSLSSDWRLLVTSAFDRDADQPEAEITVWEFSDRPLQKETRGD